AQLRSADAEDRLAQQVREPRRRGGHPAPREPLEMSLQLAARPPVDSELDGRDVHLAPAARTVRGRVGALREVAPGLRLADEDDDDDQADEEWHRARARQPTASAARVRASVAASVATAVAASIATASIATAASTVAAAAPAEAAATEATAGVLREHRYRGDAQVEQRDQREGPTKPGSFHPRLPPCGRGTLPRVACYACAHARPSVRHREPRRRAPPPREPRGRSR